MCVCVPSTHTPLAAAQTQPQAFRLADFSRKPRRSCEHVRSGVWAPRAGGESRVAEHFLIGEEKCRRAERENREKCVIWVFSVTCECSRWTWRTGEGKDFIFLFFCFVFPPLGLSMGLKMMRRYSDLTGIIAAGLFKKAKLLSIDNNSNKPITLRIQFK